ncbi:MAG: NTP transferase domain-containing protein [Candidatus Eisenbacteria sp.]|nr:NTP transferase domain-containing protein [Candidatus Eisenbacteria bacterium]
MKPVAVVPAAGIGIRLRPQTHTIPKALLNVAGKPILAHILDALVERGIERIVVVTGYRGDRVREYLADRYRSGIEVVEQKQRLGLGHAIHTTAHAVPSGPALIVLGDTIVEPEWNDFLGGEQAVLGVKEVEDPRRFGVVEVTDGRVVRVVEKPSEPKSRLAIVGIYYFPDIAPLHASLAGMIEDGRRTKGEFQLTDALQALLDGGASMRVSRVAGWFDCGKRETLLETNRHLLNQLPQASPVPGVTLVPPVFIAPTAKIEAAVVGPHVSIADGAVVREAIVRDSIINEGAAVSQILLTGSVVGENAVIRGAFERISVGDSCEVDLSGSQD